MQWEQKSLKHYLALSLIHLPLHLKAKLLILVGLDPSRLWGEWQGELLQYYPARERIVSFNEWDKVQAIMDSSSKKGLTIVTPDSSIYPKALKNVCDLPVTLFCKGNLTLLNTTSLAVVGTRAVSPYGMAVVSRFVPTLVEAGFCIVSGMARGVDALAHKWALKVQGRTVAVLGSSADEPSPASNTFLYNEILKNDGLIVSEFPPGTHGAKQNFPQRNRIIAGLSCGTLIIEAGANSGSLITAGIAVDYARDVFSVPGPVTSSLSEGVNALIKNGAVVACTPEDILAHYSLLIKYQRAKNKKVLRPEQKELLGMIPPQGASLNELLSESGNALTQLLKNIDELEQAGYINRDELGIYYLN
jgi:DNA processing protein